MKGLKVTSSLFLALIVVLGVSSSAFADGYCSVSYGPKMTPSTVTLGKNFSVNFSLKEVRGASKTFESVAVAILRPDGSYLFDAGMLYNVTFKAYQTRNLTVTNFLYTTSPTGTYKVVIRGKLPGGDWFDFDTTGNGVNPKSFTVVRHAGWILYDDFSSGTIDLNKWTVYASSAQMSVENGMLKVVQQSAPGGSYGRLFFNNPTAGIKGIRAKVCVVSSTGDFGARIAGRIGTTPDARVVWQVIQVRPSEKKIRGWVEVDTSDMATWFYNLFDVRFRKPLDTMGQWYTISATFPTLPKITFSVEDQGAYAFTPPANSFTPIGYYYQIGTRSFDGTGAGTAYFDDIEILN